MTKEQIKNKIYTIFHQYPDTLTLYPKGLTNQNWLFTIQNEPYIFRLPTLLLNNYQQEEHVIQLLKNTHLDVETIYFEKETGIKITKFVPDLVEFVESKDNHKIEETAKLMKTLHELRIQTNVHFEPIKKLEEYKSHVTNCPYDFPIEDLINSLHSLPQEEILCHNDWVSGNILFGKHKNYLIDYEYAADNDPLFDVMSFLTENNITDIDLRNRFYQIYFGQLPDIETQQKLQLWETFHNCLWCYWALMMYEEKKEAIYLEIAEEKFQAYKKMKH